MSRPVPTIEKEIRRWIPRCSKLLVALSGGPDSVALLHACSERREKSGIEIFAAHVDHGLRPESGEERQFVQALCDTQGIDLFVKELSGVPPKANIENWARNERYTFFEQLRLQHAIDWVLTAHHADDEVETFLMRFVSNKELAGISRRDGRRKLIRPFLSISKSEILKYLDERQQSYCSDASNEDVSFLRNRVRHELIPALARFDPRIIETVLSRATAISADIDTLEELAQEQLELFRSEWGIDWASRGWVRELRNRLEDNPSGVAWRILDRLLLVELGFRIGRSKSIELLQMLSGDQVAVQLGDSKELRKKAGGLLLREIDRHC